MKLGAPAGFRMPDLEGVVPGTAEMRAAIRAYAEGADRPVSAWKRYLRECLRLSMDGPDELGAERARHRDARARVLRAIG